MAEKHRENIDHYILGSALFETATGVTMAVVGCATGSTPLVQAGFLMGQDGWVNGITRGLLCRAADRTYGHPLLTIPYHLAKQPYNLVKKISNKKKRN